MTDPLATLRNTGIIAVIRAPDPDRAIEACDALMRGGVRGLEITFSTPDALAVIAELVRRHGTDAYIGAGTVTTPDHAYAAAGAGAQFLVSPGTRPELTAAMRAAGPVVMTGALTPSEVMLAVELGVDVVKIFPASLGGPAYLRALRGPFPDVPLMPTGGVSADNLGDWLAAGAVAVGAGSELVPASDLDERRYDAIEANAAQFTVALRAARALA